MAPTARQFRLGSGSESGFFTTQCSHENTGISLPSIATTPSH